MARLRRLRMATRFEAGTPAFELIAGLPEALHPGVELGELVPDSDQAFELLAEIVEARGRAGIVDDLEAALAQVEAAGAERVGGIEEYSYGRFGWFLDPDRNKIELWEPRPRVRGA